MGEPTLHWLEKDNGDRPSQRTQGTVAVGCTAYPHYPSEKVLQARQKFGATWMLDCGFEGTRGWGWCKIIYPLAKEAVLLFNESSWELSLLSIAVQSLWIASWLWGQPLSPGEMDKKVKSYLCMQIDAEFGDISSIIITTTKGIITTHYTTLMVQHIDWSDACRYIRWAASNWKAAWVSSWDCLLTLVCPEVMKQAHGHQEHSSQHEYSSDVGTT